MDNKFIGKSVKTGRLINSDNKIYDKHTDTYYLIPDLFKNETLNVCNKKALFKYKIEPNSLGEAVSTDSHFNTIYTGDTVQIDYYPITPPHKNKISVTATVKYDAERKIFYMHSVDNQAFLFTGDTQHLISNIIRIGR